MGSCAIPWLNPCIVILSRIDPFSVRNGRPFVPPKQVKFNAVEKFGNATTLLAGDMSAKPGLKKQSPADVQIVMLWDHKINCLGLED